MNGGGSLGSGGLGLHGHWTKAKNEHVEVLEPRGIGARDLKTQVQALTAEVAHSRVMKPVVHMWFPGNPCDRKPNEAEKADLLGRIEREFHLEAQPRIGVRHTLPRDLESAAGPRHPSWGGIDDHEHYAWSRTDDAGHAVDQFRNSHLRRERVIVEWQITNGFAITPMKHVSAVLTHLDRHNPEAAQAMRAAGYRGKQDLNPSPANIALYRTNERSQMERSPAVPVAAKTRHAFNARKDVLGAWRASDDGRAFEAALAERGYRLAQGAKSVLIVDPAGIEHRATELLGTAGRKLEGKAIAAAEVRARLAGLDLVPIGQARDAMRDAAHPDYAAQEPVAAPGAVPDAEDAAAAPEGAAGQAEESGIVALAGMPRIPVGETTVLPSPDPVPASVPEAPAASLDSVPVPAPAPALASSGDGAGGEAAPAAPITSGGGGGGTGGGGDEAFVEALDTSRPGDLARFLAQTAAAEKRKERRLAAVGNSASKDAQHKAAEAAKLFGERLREFFDAAAEQHNTERTEHGGSERTTTQHGLGGRDSGGHDLEGGGETAAQHGGSERLDADRLRGVVGGPGRPQSLGPHSVAGSSEAGGAVPDGPGPRPPGAAHVEPGARGANAGGEQGVLEGDAGGDAPVADVRGPGQRPAREPGTMWSQAEQHDAADGSDPDAARIGIRKRWEGQHFAARAGRRSETLRQLIAMVDDLPDRLADAEARAQARAEARHACSERRQQVDDALSRSRQRIDRVLTTAPFADPASRDPGNLIEDERARAHRTVDEAKSQAQEARQAAAAAREKLGVLGRLGFPTAERLDVAAADRAAQAAEDRARDAEEGLPHELRDAGRRGAQRAETRQADQDRWDSSRDVQQARREEYGNQLVEGAIAGGDTDIEHLAAEDLAKAREEMLRREAEQRLCEEQARIERERERAEEFEHAEPEFEHVHGGGPRMH